METRSPRNHGPRSRQIWTLTIVSAALFMVVLDNLIVSVALPSIRRDLGATMQSLEWIVNAYVLAYAVLLLTGAALGDRFGRKRVFIVGVALFTLASAGSALAPNMGLLIAARVAQGVGAAIVTPLTLTLLADAFPPNQRGLALGVWSAVSGTGIAMGPLVGGAAIELASWHWIFWINVPVGVLVVGTALTHLSESHSAENRLDLPGLALACTGLFGIVFGLVRSQVIGWGATIVIVSLTVGVLLTFAFVIWELRAPRPMLPMSFFKRRSFAVTNVVSLAMYFGMFGSIFFMSQYLQNVLGNTALQAGVKMLCWTGATMLVSPVAGVLSARYGSRLLMAAGLALQALALGWLASESTVHLAYGTMVIPFIIAGTGMALVFAPSAGAILASVRTEQTGQASGATNAIRELGGVLGISVLATVFAHHGSYASPQSYVDGLVPTMWVGTAVLAGGALIALVLPFREQPSLAPAAEDAVDAAASTDPATAETVHPSRKQPHPLESV